MILSVIFLNFLDSLYISYGHPKIPAKKFYHTVMHLKDRQKSKQ